MKARGVPSEVAAAAVACIVVVSVSAADAAAAADAEGMARVAIERLAVEAEGEEGPFSFESVPVPSRNDLAGRDGVVVSAVAGRIDSNSGGTKCLVDGVIPGGADDPDSNFFFAPGTDGGRILVDLGEPLDVRQVNTYSRHPSNRAPQVYALFGSDGRPDGFAVDPGEDEDPVSRGWVRIAGVDTRVAGASGPEAGGQVGVSVAPSGEDEQALLGRFRYLLFAVSRTAESDTFANTFFSEIDVVGGGAGASEDEPERAGVPKAPEPVILSAATEDGRHAFALDLSLAPDLRSWVEESLVPVVLAWYPKVVELLPSEGWSAPKEVRIVFRDDMGGIPAAAGGAVIQCNIGWFRNNLEGEARGAVVHELVHVVQQYGRARRSEGGQRPPGWLVEGIADYIRWFLYEPESRGAEITERNFLRARYDASYRVTGNFLDWVVRTVDKDAVAALNAAAREGRYRPELWKEITGRSVEELGEAWKRDHQRRLGIGEASSDDDEAEADDAGV